MPIIEISSLTDSGVEIFSTLTEAQLRNRIEPDKGLLIAESPKVIHVALNAGYEPLALLCEQKHITGDAAGIIERCGDIPVYTGERKLLATLTGYTLTRGVLCVKFGGMLTSDDRFYGIDVRPQNVQNYLVYTLKRLGTDYVELYQPARINPHIPVEDTIGAVLRRHTYASGSYQGQRIDL